jgi:hypothetical protein
MPDHEKTFYPDALGGIGGAPDEAENEIGHNTDPKKLFFSDALGGDEGRFKDTEEAMTEVRQEAERLGLRFGEAFGDGNNRHYEIIGKDGRSTNVMYVESTGKWSAGIPSDAPRESQRGLFWTGANSLEEALEWVQKTGGYEAVNEQAA